MACIDRHDKQHLHELAPSMNQLRFFREDLKDVI